MSTTLIVVLISVGAVAIFALGLSLTLMIKGHNIKSEISDNENMQRLGIRCAAQQMREQECGQKAGEDSSGKLPECSPAGCGSCSWAEGEEKK